MKDLHEWFDERIVEELKWHYDNYGTKQDVPFWSYDKEEEARYVKKMRKSLKRVIKFFGGEV